MTVCYFDRLPSELLIQIFAIVTDFNATPPSTTNFALRPSTDLTTASSKPLKSLSLVCHRWRIVILPTLFRYTSVILDRNAAWLRLCTGLSQDIKAHYKANPKTLDLVHKIEGLAEASLLDRPTEIFKNRPLGFEYLNPEDRIYPKEYCHWVPSTNGIFSQFLNFLKRHDLTRAVKSLVVYAHNDVTEERSNLEETMVYNEVKKLWRQIFQTMELEQIIVAAPPPTMAVLSGCQHYAWDSWLFQMPFHYLKFAKSPSVVGGPKTSSPAPPSSPTGCSRETFLYNIRPWTHMAYNEDTSIRAYGHYEYQWKMPPRVVPNLVFWLVKDRNSPRANKIQSVEYISLFPYATHLRDFVLGLASFKHLRELKIMLANPDLLDDKELMGKAQPNDIYNEWEHCYQIINHHFMATASVGTVLIPLDTKHATLREQVLEYIERRSVVPLAHRLIREDKGDLITWRIKDKM